MKSDCAEVWAKHMLKRHILRAQNKGDNYTVICGMIHLDEDDIFEEIPDPSPGEGRTRLPEARGSRRRLFVELAVLAVILVILLVIAFR